MTLNQAPRSVRVHIAFFGRRNAGKSSLINALTGQETAIVSHIKGTTTDPVYKPMEILPLGACVVIDTAGLDDTGELGEMRIRKSLEVLDKTDIAIYVVDANEGLNVEDTQIINRITQKKIPLILVINKTDLKPYSPEEINRLEGIYATSVLAVSSISNVGIDELKKAIAQIMPNQEDKFKIVGDLINPGDVVVLVTPIDKAAPKGRLILPQQQTIRDILESDAIAVVTKEHELRETLQAFRKKPALVITDSQVFLKVCADTPKDIKLTSFSILFARLKGELVELVKGAKFIERLKDGDKVLIAEACTHHQQSDDIGRVKIPRWLRQCTGKKLEFEFASGNGFSKEIERYALIVHCGGCMLNRAEMISRLEYAKRHNVPIVNYGVLIAYVQGVLERSLEPFPLAKMAWNEVRSDE